MRISNLRLYEIGTNNVNSKLADQVKAQQQLSTGRRILTPSDDPVASARALTVENSSGRLEQFLINAKGAQDTLTNLENQVTGVSNLLPRLTELAVEAGNGSLSDPALKNISEEVSGLFNQLLGFANAKDADGQYVFSGFQGQTQAFTTTADPLSALPTVQYAGDQGIREVRISEVRQIQTSETGENVFGSWPGALTAPQAADQSLFAAVKTLYDATQAGSTSATYQADVASALDGLKAAQDRVGLEYGKLGSRQNEISDVINVNGSIKLQFDTEDSDLTSVDYAEAVSTFSQSQQLLEVARKTYQQVQGLSLFNYL